MHTQPEATVTVWIFKTSNGRRGHFIQVDGSLPARIALTLALAAILTRLRHRIG